MKKLATSLGNHDSLTEKTLWILVLWGLLVTVGFIWFMNHQLAKVFDRQKFNDAQQIARSFEAVISTSPSEHSLQPLMRKLSQESEIKLIALVSDSPSRVIAATETQWINRTVIDISEQYINIIQELKETLETQLPYKVYRKDIQEYCFSFPMRLNNITDSVLLIHLDAAPTRQAIHELSLQIGGWILGLISIFILSTYILLYYFVLRPLQNISDVVKTRLHTQQPEYAKKFSEDELGVFAEQFNQLLQQMEQKLHEVSKIALIANSNHALLITDNNGYIEWANAGFTQLTEYQLDEVLGKKPGAFLQGPETDPRTVNQIREFIQQHQSFDIEMINYSKTYRQYWVEIHAQPVFNEQGQLLYYFAILIDITARKMTENMLQKNAIHFHHLIEKSANSLIVTDKHGSMHYVDKISDMILGKQAKNLINLIFNLPEADDATQEHFSGHEMLIGEVRMAETDWQGEKFYFASLRDISDKPKEIVKYEHDPRYQTAIEAIGAGLIIIDTSGTVLEANIEYVRLTRRKHVNYIIGNNLLEWVAIYDKERSLQMIQHCLEKGFAKNFDVDHMTPDGKIVPIEMNAKLINIQGKNRILALCWELSDHHLRQQLYLSHDFLHQVINSLPMFIFIKEASSSHFVLWNHFGEQLFQLSASTLLGRADYEVFSEQSQVDFFWQHDAEVMTYRKLIEFPKLWSLETETGTRQFRITKLPLLDEQDCPQFILGMLQEVAPEID